MLINYRFYNYNKVLYHWQFNFSINIQSGARPDWNWIGQAGVNFQLRPIIDPFGKNHFPKSSWTPTLLSFLFHSTFSLTALLWIQLPPKPPKLSSPWISVKKSQLVITIQANQRENSKILNAIILQMQQISWIEELKCTAQVRNHLPPSKNRPIAFSTCQTIWNLKSRRNLTRYYLVIDLIILTLGVYFLF